MSIRNKVQLIGNVGNIEVTIPENGNKYVSISLATNENYTSKDGKKVTDTDWHYLTVFGKLADIAEKYVIKGKQIAVEARLKYSSYENKDGNKTRSISLIVNDLVLLGGKEVLESNKK